MEHIRVGKEDGSLITDITTFHMGGVAIVGVDIHTTGQLRGTTQELIEGTKLILW